MASAIFLHHAPNIVGSDSVVLTEATNAFIGIEAAGSPSCATK